MRIRFLLPALLLISNLTIAQWTWQHPLPQGNNLNDLYVFSENNMISVGDVGTVLRTIDGGLSWQRNSLTGNLYSIDFISSSIGFILGDSGIYKTVDNGINWNKFANVVGTEIQMVNENIGYITQIREGGTPWDYANVLKTTNCGITWISKYQDYNDWYSVYFLNENLGWCSGSQGLLKTTNGGNTWILSSAIQEIHDVYFLNENLGWATSYNYVYKTTNGGDSWQNISYWYGGGKSKIYFMNEMLGWVIDDQSEYVYRTTDGGINWSDKINEYSGQGLNSFKFIDANNGFAIGSKGKILKINNGGVTQLRLDQTKAFWINKIKIIDDNFGLAVGDKILKTTNGGNNWEISQPSGSYSFNDIEIINQNIAYAVGYSRNFKTIDGGSTWFDINTGLSSYSSTYDVEFINENIGWWVGDYGSIFKTTNGGNSYTIQKQSGTYEEWVSSIDMLDENIGYSLDNYFVDNVIRILKTTNGGSSWINIFESSDISPSESNKIIFKNNELGYVIGDVFTKFTTDGGYTWNNLMQLSWARDIAFINEQVGYAVTTHPALGSSGNLYKTTDGGNNWTDNGVVYGGKINSVNFINENIGWIAGGNAIIKIGIIQPNNLDLVKPDGDENWQVGGTYDIAWNSTNVSNVKIDYTTDSGVSWLPVIAWTPSDGSYSWTIPNTPSTQSKVRITDVDNPSH